MTLSDPCTTAFSILPDRATAEGLGAALEELDPAPLGVGVFEMEDGSNLWEVGAYFDERPDLVQLALLEAAWGAEFIVSDVPETDWVAKVRRELAPVEAGRFWVHGSHDTGSAPEGRIPLLIEASMAFGTGHHDTTRGCLIALDQLADGPAPARIADIGCGTAVLAMAAAHVFPEAEIFASDNDSVAIEVTEANLKANAMDGRLRCFEAEGFDHAALAGPFDLVFANILKPPLLALAPDMAARISPGGRAVLSGILQYQAEEIIAAYQAEGFTLERRIDLGEWAILVLGH